MSRRRFRSAATRLQVTLCTGIWLALGFLTGLAARAGGAGGHGSSHSGGGSHGSSSHGGSSFHGAGGGSGGGSFSFLLFCGIVAFLVLWFYLQKKKSSAAADHVSPTGPVTGTNSLQRFLADHPEFDLAAFTAKARGAFIKIQDAWTAQDIAPIRPFISDGMYQRFATQFRMMGLLQQRNRLDQIRILRVEAVSARTDGAFDVIDVYVEASMHDSFTCELDHALDTESDDTFVEYWSFIRKRDIANANCDIFANTQCPSCGAPLPKDMGELCRCAYCQVMVNSGEFDWVLAEITQQQDYGDQSRMAFLAAPDLPEAIARITPECPDFSIQLAEDKASNAFLQIMTALATRNPAAVRRFVSDEVLAQITARISGRNLVFNRIYLNEAVLLNASRVGARHRLAIGLSASMQRVEVLPDRRLAAIDAEEIRSGQVLVMERDADAVPEKGSLYQHQCATCGGAAADSLDLNCPYCGTPLNSTRNEWIVTGLVAAEEFVGGVIAPLPGRE